MSEFSTKIYANRLYVKIEKSEDLKRDHMQMSSILEKLARDILKTYPGQFSPCVQREKDGDKILGVIHGHAKDFVFGSEHIQKVEDEFKKLNFKIDNDKDLVDIIRLTKKEKRSNS